MCWEVCSPRSVFLKHRGVLLYTDRRVCTLRKRERVGEGVTIHRTDITVSGSASVSAAVRWASRDSATTFPPWNPGRLYVTPAGLAALTFISRCGTYLQPHATTFYNWTLTSPLCLTRWPILIYVMLCCLCSLLWRGVADRTSRDSLRRRSQQYDVFSYSG